MRQWTKKRSAAPNNKNWVPLTMVHKDVINLGTWLAYHNYHLLFYFFQLFVKTGKKFDLCHSCRECEDCYPNLIKWTLGHLQRQG